ncbi:hypothetical protein IE53DRAFT_368869 [Violaceomyces palustris]|uniref:Uncharacterized protein n=1 Tax=Violaceomyces palustris TaxID=1673888 RepID=A0ACD0NXC7_9BASI|nr:hypothetical protein IE53DRAFT_368869 [Violaceomyces palustris]
MASGHSNAGVCGGNGGSQASHARVNQPLFSKSRARQIQADEGISTSPYRPPGSHEADPPLPSISDPGAKGGAVRGRARAGTLPSSWGNAAPLNLAFDDTEGSSGSPQASSHERGQLRRSDEGGSFLGRGSMSAIPPASALFERDPLNFSAGLPHMADASEESPFGQSQANRLRSGSLTLSSSGLSSNPFGPSIFSSNWQPSRSGLSGVSMMASEEASVQDAIVHLGHSQPGQDELGPRDSFDGSSTLDYLGLADITPKQLKQTFSPLRLSSSNFTNMRNRASTLASAVRPRPTIFDGRTRSSSFLPGVQAEGGMEHEDERADMVSDFASPSQSGTHTPMSLGHHASLASAALHNRLGQLSSDTASSGSRPRAISMGVLDAPIIQHSEPSPPPSATFPVDVDMEQIRNYAISNNIDPIAFLQFAEANGYSGPRSAAAGISGSASASSSASLGGNAAGMGRNRAGTIAAMGGPGGRQRTEQELSRMMQLASLSNQRASKLSSYPQSPGKDLGPSTPVESMTPTTPGGVSSPSLMRHSGSVSGPPSTPGGGGGGGNQPSRSLWIGGLDAATTAQELMHVFAPYGAIESLRLLPEKECGFVNFVDVQDAIKAKDDVMNRLGGRIGTGTTSPNGTVKIGYGKIDSAPQAPPSAGAAFKGGSSPKFESAGLDGMPGTPGETNGQPTRALWIGSIPASTTPATLLSIFSPFGPIESARILTHKNCGFINFERVEDAFRARKSLNGRDVLGSEVGAVRIGFAKVPVKNVEGLPADHATPEFAAAVDALASLRGAGPVSAEQQALGGNLENYRSNMVLSLLQQHEASPPKQPRQRSPLSQDTSLHIQSAPAKSSTFPHHTPSSTNSIVPSSDKGGVPLPPEMRPKATITDQQLMMRELSEGDPNVDGDVGAVANYRGPTTYYTKIPLVSEVLASRRFDTTRLRDIRKSLDGGCPQAEADRIASDFLPDIVDLSSDYIGNTVVQKFFELCSEATKQSLLEALAPHLAMIGTHKNGTWAAQKIIDCARTDVQRELIAKHLRPYVPPLLLDQFGNYVAQCVLPFGSPQSDFLFDAMIDRCWEIAQGRFGARSMRACLENSLVTKLQQKRVAIAIILNSVPLATSPNGALLLTWLLDTSGLSGRYRLLAPRFAPHLSHLCTHKLASLTVLRIVNQRSDPTASAIILQALFDPGRRQQLEEILLDQVHGSQFITKVLASPSLDPQAGPRFAEVITRMLQDHKLVNVPAYRRLAEDLGLPVPPQLTPMSTQPHLDAPMPLNAGLGPARPGGAPLYGGLLPPGSGGPPYSDGIMDLNVMIAQMSLQQRQAQDNGGRSGAAVQARLPPNVGQPSLMNMPALPFGVLPPPPPPPLPPLQQEQQQQPSLPQPPSAGSSSMGSSLRVETQNGPGMDFHSSTRLRSPQSDAFNPWANTVLPLNTSPEYGHVPASLSPSASSTARVYPPISPNSAAGASRRRVESTHSTNGYLNGSVVDRGNNGGVPVDLRPGDYMEGNYRQYPQPSPPPRHYASHSRQPF